MKLWSNEIIWMNKLSNVLFYDHTEGFLDIIFIFCKWKKILSFSFTVALAVYYSKVPQTICNLISVLFINKRTVIIRDIFTTKTSSKEITKSNMNLHRNQHGWNSYDCHFLLLPKKKTRSGGNLPEKRHSIHFPIL